MNETLLAYLAGAMDADGWFGIKRSTYHRRVRGDAVNPIYSERAALKQVTPQVPQLLRDTFGGSLREDKPRAENRKPLYTFHTTDKIAATVARALLPYLRIKQRHAEIVLELRLTKDGHYWQAAYWFEREHPEWREMELITSSQVRAILNYKHQTCVAQAVRKGTLLGLPWNGRPIEVPRYPRLLVEQVAQLAGRDGRARVQAPQLVAWRERLFQEIRELNKTGTSGTPTYHKTGYFVPID